MQFGFNNAGSKPSTANEGLNAALLSSIAGYVDTAGCLALFGLLPAHLTADLVTVSSSFTTQGSIAASARMTMIPLFMLSVAGTALLTRWLRKRGRSTLTPVLALMTAGLSLFCLTGAALGHLATRPEAWVIFPIGGSAVVAMGIQNTLMREAFSGLCPTTVMTGNLTQFTIDLVDTIASGLGSNRRNYAGSAEQKKTTTRLARFGLPLAGFLVGAIAGAWLTTAYGFVSIALPTFVSCVLTFMSSGVQETARATVPAPTPIRAPARPPVSGASRPYSARVARHSGVRIPAARRKVG